MHRMNPLHGFHFQDEAAVDEQIQFQIVAQLLFPVDKRHTLFDFDKQVICDEFDDHALLVDRFKQTRPKLRVHRDCAPDDDFGEFVNQYAGSFSRKRSAENYACFMECVLKRSEEYADPSA